MELEAGLHEPYERYACNELRRECYRRKLKIVKRGPRANATKAGFIRLLHESDAVESPRDAGEASRAEARSNCKKSHVVEHENPNTEGMSVVPVSPSEVAKPVVSLGKRAVGVSTVETATKLPSNKRRNLVGAQTTRMELVDDVEVSVDASESPMISCVATPSPASVSLLRDFDAWTAETMVPPSWERLHARLEVVSGQLRILRYRQDLNEDEKGDVEFYVRLKKQLQERLLASLTES